MRFAKHVVQLVGQAAAYGIVTRRLSVIVLILLGLALLALSLAAQTAAPLVLYPFA